MCTFDSLGNMLGANSPDNQYDSSLVVPNKDGSLLERTEYMIGLIESLSSGAILLQGVAAVGTNSTTSIVIAALAGYGDDFFNNRWYLQVLHNENSAGNAPEAETRKITDYASSTGTFTCDAFSVAVEAGDLCLILHEAAVAVGRNDGNNVFDSTNVVANANGSVLERLKDLRDALTTIAGYIDTEVAAIKAVTDAMPDAGQLSNLTNAAESIQTALETIDNYVDTEVAAIKAATDQVGTLLNTGGAATLAAILGDFANSALVTRIAALQTELNKVGVIANSGGSATLGAILGDFANSALVTRIAALQTELDKVGTLLNSGGTAKLGDILGDFANSALVTRIAALQTELDKVGTLLNSGGTAKLGNILGDFANSSLVTRLAALQTAIDGFAAGGGDGKAIVRKTVTFSNTTDDVNLFSITGGVSYKLFAFCTTNVESAGGCNIGVDHNSGVVIADTDCTTLEANDVWHDATPDAVIENESVAVRKVAYGGTIALDVEAEKQVDSGVIVFVCVYTPLTADGAVAAAA